MPDIETIRGDSRVVAIPVFDADLDRFRTQDEVSSANAIEYVVVDAPEAETVHIEKAFADADVTVQTPEEIDTIELDGVDSDAGVVRVDLSPTDTGSLPIASLWHELQITDGNDNVSTVMRGEFDVIESATN